MIAKGDIVLVDTNVIIEAHRARCWRAIVNFFRVETVEKCCEEAATGDKRRADYVIVDAEEMKKVVAVHAVNLMELAEIETRLAEPDRIDMGEKHLLAHGIARPGVWYLSASDRAAVRAGNELGFLERFVSLEALARAVGISAQFKNHFTEKWLRALRTDILMGGTQ
jgi:predicted DNA binding protein